jgi:hypothetical protein
VSTISSLVSLKNPGIGFSPSRLDPGKNTPSMRGRQGRRIRMTGPYSWKWTRQRVFIPGQQADQAHVSRFHPEILLTENIVFRKRNSGDRGGTQTEVLLRHLNGKPPQPLIQRELYELAALEER